MPSVTSRYRTSEDFLIEMNASERVYQNLNEEEKQEIDRYIKQIESKGIKGLGEYGAKELIFRLAMFLARTKRGVK